MRRALQNLLLSTASAALFLALLEGGARLVERRRPPSPQRADYIWDWQKQWEGDFYTLASDETGWPPGAEFNADGVRDRLHPPERPDGVARVAILGDSVTFGHGLEPSEAFPQALQGHLEEEGRPIEVMSVALWGWSTRQQRLAYERIVRRYRPDRVLLAVCLNDIPELLNNLRRPPRWLSALHGRSALVRLLVNAQGREIQDVEQLFSERDARKVREGFALFFEELRALRDEVERDGSSLAVVVFPFRFQLEEGAPPPSVQQEIGDFCRTERLPLLDLLPALSRAGVTAFLDYDHLSASGARLVAEEIAKSRILPHAPAAAEVLAARYGRVPDSAAELARALVDGDPGVRASAAWALGRRAATGASRRVSVAMDEAAILGLAAAASGDSSERVRTASARALGRIGSSSRTAAAAQPGAPLAEGVLPATRSTAAAVPGAPLAEAALLKALSDPRQGPRWAAAEALHAIGPTPAAAPALVAALRSDDAFVRAFATFSLGELGPLAGQEAGAALAEAVQTQGGAGRAGASAALAKLGDAAATAVPALIQELSHEREARRWRAARTLGRIGPSARPALPALIGRLADESPAVRAAAARALGRIGSRDAIDALVSAVKQDPTREVREEASKALSRIPGS